MEVEVSGLVKTYDGRRVVDEVSFRVPESSTLVLLGTSGSGKTTCLKMLNRLIELDGGSIRLGGQDVLQLSAVALRRQIGYVIQQIGLFPHMTIAENIEVVPQLLGWGKAKRSARTEELLQLLGLEREMASRLPAALSGGQRQRVGIARALAAEPGLILLDEPFGALDPITRASIQQEFLRLPQLRETTQVLVTHDVMEAVRLGDTVALLDGGQLQQVGAPHQLLFEPANAFVKQFFDDQRFALQLEVVKMAQLEREGQAPPTEGRVRAFSPQASVGSVLEALEADPASIAVEGTDFGFSNRQALLAAYYNTVEAWRG